METDTLVNHLMNNCGASFSSHGVKERVLLPSMKDIIGMPICVQTMPAFTSAIQHQVDKTRGDAFCTECDFTFDNQQDFNWHMAQHDAGKNWKCDGCLLMFSQKSNMKIHNNCEHLKIKFPCPVCTKNFSTWSNMKSHAKKAHPNHEEVQVYQLDAKKNKKTFPKPHDEKGKICKKQAVRTHVVRCDRCDGPVYGNIERHKQSNKCRSKMQQLQTERDASNDESVETDVFEIDTDEASNASDVEED
jgi:hypothetical protein